MIKDGCIVLSDSDLNNDIFDGFLRLYAMFDLLDRWCDWAHFRGVEDTYRPATWADWWPLEQKLLDLLDDLD